VPYQAAVEEGVARAASPGSGTATPPQPVAGKPPPGPSRRSQRGLDWFVFFVADVQTGFGPFVSVYLTEQKWTQVDIGMVLSIGSLVALFGQMPGGALVDAARSERLVAGVAIAVIAASALLFALSPSFPIVLSGAVLHSAASCVLGPAMAAISLGLVGHAAIGVRLGRNARFAAIGNGLAAAAMGASGYFLSPRSVFLVTAALLGPALMMLRLIKPQEIDPARAHGGVPEPKAYVVPTELLRLARKRPLVVFAGGVMLFHLANAAMLPFMGSVLTMRSTHWATVMIAACIVGPQILVAIFSPSVGRLAQSLGRRPLLLLAFAALPLRGLLFAIVVNPYLLVVIQLLDGITAAIFAVLVPLVIADLTRGTGHFNLGQGIVGTTVGIGASVSTTYAGYLSDHFGSTAVFVGLAAVATLGLLVIWALMPETKPQEDG
jgi:predicted MFS family arabinose efflux permease